MYNCHPHPHPHPPQIKHQSSTYLTFPNQPPPSQYHLSSSPPPASSLAIRIPATQSNKDAPRPRPRLRRPNPRIPLQLRNPLSPRIRILKHEPSIHHLADSRVGRWCFAGEFGGEADEESGGGGGGEGICAEREGGGGEGEGGGRKLIADTRAWYLRIEKKRRTDGKGLLYLYKELFNIATTTTH